METNVKNVMEEIRPHLISFCQDLVRIKSYTGQEEKAVRRVEREMYALGYDQVTVDSLGSVVGVIGNGPKKVYFDGHMDTVLAKPEEWSFDPWAGDIVDGMLRGRGSVDMKCSAAAAVYAAYAARRLGYTDDKTIFVSCSIMEEDYEGVAVANEFKELGFCPDFSVICEPTRLRIGNGHFGRALFEVTVKGVGIHASRHQMGDNALNKILPIVERVKAKGDELVQAGGEQGAVASTKLETEGVSINSIPGRATLTIDRRTTPADTEETLAAELAEYCRDIADTEWNVVDTYGKSWRGQDAVLHNLIAAWQIPEDHALIQAASAAARAADVEPIVYRRNGCTNAWVTAGSMHIPTIVFGAGDEKNCHVIDEMCPVDQILTACAVYALLEREL